MKKKYVFNEKDEKEVEHMAGIGLRAKDISHIKGLSPATLKRLYQPALTRGKKNGHFELFETAHYMATKKYNCAMLIFLLKTRCGLKDKSNVSMTLEEKRPNDQKRNPLPCDPLLAAKVYREIMLDKKS